MKNWQKRINSNDVVLIPGDISWALNIEDAEFDLQFIKSLPGKKILIKGNHDYWWQSIKKVRQLLKPDCQVIQNDSVKVANVAIAGTRGWKCPGGEDFTEHDQKIFRREVLRLELSLKSINDEYDFLVVMTHFMPANYLHQKNEFIELMEKYRVDFCIYGHLHGEPAHDNRLSGEKWGINFKLVSADFINFEPVLILNKNDIS